MVSQSGSPPIPMPVQVPPGHVMQQIVDESGTLRHVILSTAHNQQIHQQGGIQQHATLHAPFVSTTVVFLLSFWAISLMILILMMKTDNIQIFASNNTSSNIIDSPLSSNTLCIILYKKIFLTRRFNTTMNVCVTTSIKPENMC